MCIVVCCADLYSQHMQIVLRRDMRVKVSHNARLAIRSSWIACKPSARNPSDGWSSYVSPWRKRSLICVRSRSNWFCETSLRWIELSRVSQKYMNTRNGIENYVRNTALLTFGNIISQQRSEFIEFLNARDKKYWPIFIRSDIRHAWYNLLGKKDSVFRKM